MSNSSQSGGVGSSLPNSSLALISLVTGILGLTLFPFVGSIIAVITGRMARREIQESAGTLGGEGLAQIGLILGWIGIGLGVLGMCIFGTVIAIPLCAVLFEASSEGASLLLYLI